MEKGKLNVNFWVYTLIALILSIVGYLWINCIFFVFILLYEKNDYLTKQVLQPFIIVVCQYLITLAVSFLSGIIFFAVPDSVTAVLSLILILGVGIIFFAFKVIGIVQVATKKEVQIPIFSSLANSFSIRSILLRNKFVKETSVFFVYSTVFPSFSSQNTFNDKGVVKANFNHP